MTEEQELEPTFREKILINVFTPLDDIADLFPWEDVAEGINTYESKNRYLNKIEDYRRLLENLEEHGPTDKVLSNYMGSYCGRIQVRLARRRGYLSKERYNELASIYGDPLNIDLSKKL